MTLYEVLNLLIQGLVGIVFLCGLIVALWQLRALKTELQSNHEWYRRHNAFEYSFSNDPDMLKVLTNLDVHLKISSAPQREISVAEIDELMKTNYAEIRKDIHFALARLEYMCTAIKHGVADEAICRDLLENRTITLHRYFRQHIEQVRSVRGSKKIFENLAYYAELWGRQAPSIPPRPKTG